MSPRRKARGDDQEPGPVLMLPAPRATGSSHGHQHDIDAYQAPAGAVPGKISHMQTQAEPIKRKMTAKDEAKRALLKSEQKALGNRYNRYLDAMVKHGGNRELAIAEIMPEIPAEGIAPRLMELHAEICRGIGHTELAEVLVENDLGIRSRVGILRGWAFSDNAAASINAIKLVNELAEDTRGDDGFEVFLRIHKDQDRLQGGKR